MAPRTADLLGGDTLGTAGTIGYRRRGRNRGGLLSVEAFRSEASTLMRGDRGDTGGHAVVVHDTPPRYNAAPA